MLKAGDVLTGNQKGRPVIVEILTTDISNNTLNGCFSIEGLSATHKTVQTYFEAEIISRQYPFATRKWQADERVDLKCWSRVEGFSLACRSDTSNLTKATEVVATELEDYVFMRWKELFVLPNHKQVDDVSYAGFYYCSYRCSTGKLNGFYYNGSSSSMMQPLELSLTPRSDFGTFVFC